MQLAKDDPLPKLRFRWAPRIDDALPIAARTLLKLYRELADGRSQISFRIPALPPSVNSIYLRATKKRTYADGRVENQHTVVLDQEARDFVKLTAFYLNARRGEWTPRGLSAAVVVFESPTWVTAAKELRKKDLDNKIKVLFDAAAMALGKDDIRHSQLAAYKLFGHRDRTHVWLFDVGDIMDSSSDRGE